MGERTFPVEVLQELLGRVKALRNRLESPRLATDLFGEDAPSAEELARLRSAVDRAMSQTSHRLRVSRGGHRGQGGGGSASDEEDEQCGPGGTASRRSVEGRPVSAAMAAGGGGATPTDLPFLMKLESMLSVQSGLDVVDSGFANWLATLLPSN